MTNDEMLFARCKSGKKWFWATFNFGSPKPLDYGYESTVEEAEAHRPAGVRQCLANSARWCLRCLCAMKKAGKGNRDAHEAHLNEYLYTDWCSDYDSTFSSSRHLIVKKTKKKVFVESRSWDYAEEVWERYYGRECIALDRAELEREGKAWSRRGREMYYTTPWEERDRPSAPECLRALGLTNGATESQIRQAYRRLVKQVHPDTGGSHEACVALHRAYEQALDVASKQAGVR